MLSSCTSCVTGASLEGHHALDWYRSAVRAFSAGHRCTSHLQFLVGARYRTKYCDHQTWLPKGLLLLAIVGLRNGRPFIVSERQGRVALGLLLSARTLSWTTRHTVTTTTRTRGEGWKKSIPEGHRDRCAWRGCHHYAWRGREDISEDTDACCPTWQCTR